MNRPTPALNPVLCRVRIWLDDHSPFEFGAELTAAFYFAEDALRHGIEVVIDAQYRSSMRPLPNEIWWAQPGPGQRHTHCHAAAMDSGFAGSIVAGN